VGAASATPRPTPSGYRSSASSSSRAVLSDPEPDAFEAWLLERCLSGETASMGAMRAMAQEVLTEWRLTVASVEFRDWLAAGAPSEDRTP
jgi:hypothetical protein